jgi:hypothetical protein
MEWGMGGVYESVELYLQLNYISHCGRNYLGLGSLHNNFGMTILSIFYRSFVCLYDVFQNALFYHIICYSDFQSGCIGVGTNAFVCEE